MDFTLNEEQGQFADSLQRWIARDYTFEQRRNIIHAPAGCSAAAWNTLAELGMLALPVPVEQGGFDGTATDIAVVMQELGRGLVVEPYLATVMGAECLRLGGVHGALLAQVAAGTLKLACAFGEVQSRYDLADVRTVASANGDGVVIDGAKSVVLHGAQVDVLLVSARTGDALHVHAVAADAPGVTITDYRTLDGLRAADIRFSSVRVDAAARIGGYDVLEQAADYGAVLLCAEAVGAMEALFAATLDYLKTRKQFGAPIGKFQLLQHRMADMVMHLEQARSMALLAAVRYAEQGSDVAARRRVVSAAKFRVGEAARFIGQQAVQLHGGMGVTDELPASHYFKRLTMIALTLGDADHHLQRFIAQPGFMKEEHA